MKTSAVIITLALFNQFEVLTVLGIGVCLVLLLGQYISEREAKGKYFYKRDIN